MYSAILTLDAIANLTVLYNEPHRHYHNLEHVQRCLAQAAAFYRSDEAHENPSESNLDKSLHLAYNRERTACMIWFHDAVYNPYAAHGDNETDSANLWATFADKKDVPSGVYADVYNGIVFSAEHLKDNENNLSHAQKVFLDCDLHGLGLDYYDFLRNGINIRREYLTTHSEDQLRANEDKFFTAMLQRKRIFYTDYFYNKYEAQARENMRMRLEEGDWHVGKLKAPSLGLVG